MEYNITNFQNFQKLTKLSEEIVQWCNVQWNSLEKQEFGQNHIFAYFGCNGVFFVLKIKYERIRKFSKILPEFEKIRKLFIFSKVYKN
jgi:hypothetical protein